MHARVLIAYVSIVMLISFPAAASSESIKATNSQDTLYIYFEYSFGNVLDTFSGTYTRDLVVGADTTVAFSLTATERDSILEKAEELGFFSLPEELYNPPNVRVYPDCSPDVLRLKVGDRDHTVRYPCPYIIGDSVEKDAILKLASFIRRIIETKEAFKQLPRPNGSYG